VSEVAVVIPCYELGETVTQAVGSALAQSRSPAEVVVVDDGSTQPETLRALAELEELPRVRVLRGPNRGVAHARNRGAAATSAPYLVFLDADDLLARDYCARLAEQLDRDSDLDFVTCAARGWPSGEVDLPPPLELLPCLAFRTVHVSSMVRRALFDDLGGFDERLPTLEDYAFWIAALARGARGLGLDEVLFTYRVRQDSRSAAGMRPGPFLTALEAIYRRHATLVEALGPALLAAKDEWIAEQARHHEWLLEQRQGEGAGSPFQAPPREGSSQDQAPPPPVGSPGEGGAILMYHEITDADLKGFGLHCRPAHFREHLELIRERYHPLPLRELVQRAAEGTLPAGAVAITLDDGRLDHLRNAAPLLAELQIPATFFVNSEALASPSESWEVILERVFLGDAPLPPALHLTLEGSRHVFPSQSESERAEAFRGVYALARDRAEPERRAICEELLAWSGIDPTPREVHRRLVRAELLELASDPLFEIGGHGRAHLDLACCDVAMQRFELAQDKHELERTLGRELKSYAYAFGSYGDSGPLRVQEAGYACALTVEPGQVVAACDPLQLPRYEIKDWSGAALRQRLETWFAGREASEPAPTQVAADPIRSGLVSVIVPVKDRLPLLQECVASVLAQTWAPLELILVDDGSSEDTASYCAELAAAHPAVRSLRLEGTGRPGLVREAGRQIARGEFIHYLDSDDLLRPRKLEVHVRALRANPDCDVAYAGARRYLRGERGREAPCERTGEALADLLPEFVAQRYWLTSVPLYTRRICDRIGPWSDLGAWEDLEYDMRLAALGARAVHCPGLLTDIRDHEFPRLSPADQDQDPGYVALEPPAFREIYRHARRGGVAPDDPCLGRFLERVQATRERCLGFGLDEGAELCERILRGEV
jgi:glycosyltransferase involved in cell wall biosynthesis/peptidoglycan/xylan/chitin deacetylase (PgdA/CDA1 family)